MKKLLPCLLICAFLLVGCSNAAGFLSMPDSPSAELSDRPAFVSQDTPQSSADTSSTNTPVMSERNMTFLETDTPHLYRILTRKGDLEVLGMAYGDGMYFALTSRESGNAITIYDTNGIGMHAGVLQKEFSSPVLLGYADGYACLYSADTYRTFACKTDSTYVWFDRGQTDILRLYRGGYVHVKDNKVTFYGPQYAKSYSSYTLPEGYTYLLGDEEHAVARNNDGTLSWITFDAETYHETKLHSAFSYSGGALSASEYGQSVMYNPYDQTVVASPEHVRVLASGKGYLIEERKNDIRFVRTTDKCVFSLPKNGTFAFGGRTETGFLFAQNGAWYLLEDEAFDLDTTVLQRKENTELLYTAGQALCTLAAGDIRLFDDGALLDTVQAARITDGETLFSAAAYLHSALKDIKMRDTVCIYLCADIIVSDTVVPYTVIEDGTTVNILLDVTDTNYKTQLDELLTMLQEGIVG